MDEKQKNTINNYIYYFIIGFISLISCIFLPMLSSSVGFAVTFPTTVAGWCLWTFTKLSAAIINIMIFFCFTQQAKTNVHNHPMYLEARKLLQELDNEKEVIPISPQQWLHKEYFKKVVSIFITSALSTIVLGQALLTFDLVMFLSHTLTMAFGVVFGILQMKRTEQVFTEDYLEYARYKVKEAEKKAADNAKVAQDAAAILKNIRTNAEENKCLQLTESHIEM